MDPPLPLLVIKGEVILARWSPLLSALTHPLAVSHALDPPHSVLTGASEKTSERK